MCSEEGRLCPSLQLSNWWNVALKKLQFPQEPDSRRRERLVPGAAEPQEDLERDFPEFLLTWQHTLPERLEVRQ